MKKVFILIFSILLLATGCVFMDNQPSDKVKEFFNNYKNNSDEVVDELNEYLDSQDLDEETYKEYKELYLRQYSNLEYEIKSQKIDGDSAVVEVQISVFDYYKIDKDASEYLTANKADFINDDGDIDFAKYITYKVSKMIDTTDRVEYMLSLNLKKENDKWVMQKLSNDELEKIHGTYEY